MLGRRSGVRGQAQGLRWSSEADGAPSSDRAHDIVASRCASSRASFSACVGEAARSPALLAPLLGASSPRAPLPLGPASVLGPAPCLASAVAAATSTSSPSSLSSSAGGSCAPSMLR